MIEKAARCLEPGAKPALRHSHKVPTCRSLHQTFWRHGAGDLALPAWCFLPLSSIFEPVSTANFANVLPPLLTNYNSLLDFLYPPKTRAYISRILRESCRDTPRYKPARTKSKTFVNGHTRSYVSSSKANRATLLATKEVPSEVREGPLGQAGEEDTTRNPLDVEEHRSLDSDKSLDGDQILSPDSRVGLLAAYERQLSLFRQDGYSSSHDKLWNTYQAVSDTEKPALLSAELLSILGSSPREIDFRHFVTLFEKLPPEEISAEVYGHAILAYANLEIFEKAFILHQKCTETFNLGQGTAQGGAFLLKQLIRKQYWQLASEAWTDLYLSTERDGNFERWRRQTFEQISKISQYPAKVSDFLEFILKYSESFLHEDKIHNDSLRQFIFASVTAVFDNDRDFGERTVSVLQNLRELGLTRAFWYEKACLQALKYDVDPKQRYQDAVQRYEMYRTDHAFDPNRKLLSSMLHAALAAQDFDGTEMMYSDWVKFHGDTLGLTLAGLLMDTLAARGEDQRVERLFKTYYARCKSDDLRLVYPLLQSQARLANPPNVEKLLDWLVRKHKVQPDIRCWNILLRAYVNANDLDGAKALFRELLDGEVDPDQFTFDIYAVIIARNAGVETIDALEQACQDRGWQDVLYLKEMRVLAMVKNEDLTGAYTQLKGLMGRLNAEACTRAWNYLVTAYALRGDSTRCLKVAAQMKDLKVRYDEWTYAALMRLFILRNRVASAQTIFDQLLTDPELKPAAFHYTIMMDAYSQIFNFEVAYRLHSDMLQRRIRPTIASRLALIELQIRAEQYGNKQQRLPRSKSRFWTAEELLEEVLQPGNRSMLATDDALFSAKRSAPTSGSFHYPLFNMLFRVYGKQRMQDLLEMILRRQDMSRTVEGNYGSAALNVVLTIMKLRHQQGNSEDVESLWNFATTAASNVAQSAGSGSIAPSRQTMLCRHLDVYMRSLHDSGRWQELMPTIDDLRSKGFVADYLNLNLYVLLLVEVKEYRTAFQFCEDELIRGFLGWEEDRAWEWKKASGQRAQGMEFTGMKHRRIDPRRPRMTFQTAAHLASVLRDLEQLATSQRDAQIQLDHIEKNCPRTIKAIAALPRVDHPLLVQLGLEDAGEKKASLMLRRNTRTAF